MNLTKLSLTNFRSFGEQTQTIDFGKVTLLFGPNSIGKSTVLLALFYVQEILAKGDCNPQYIEALGDKYVGGFKNLVNGKDLNKTIKIKLEYEKSALGNSYFDVIDLIKTGDIPPKLDDDELSPFVFALMESAAVAAANIAIEFEIAWTARSGGNAYIKACNIDLNDLAIATLTSDEGSNPTITGLNYLHPLLLSEGHDEWLLDLFENQGEIHNDLLKKVSELQGIELPTDAESKLATEAKREKLMSTVAKIEHEIAGIELEKIRAKDNEDLELIEKLKLKQNVLDDQLLQEKEKCLWVMEDFPVFKDHAFVSDFHALLCANITPSEYNNSNYMTGINFKAGDNTFLHPPLSFNSSLGALPNLANSCFTSFEASDLVTKKAVDEIISDIIVSPLDNLLQLLNESLSIGPLRVIPDNSFQPNMNTQQKNWFDGSAAWVITQRALKMFDDNERHAIYVDTELTEIQELISNNKEIEESRKDEAKSLLEKARLIRNTKARKVTADAVPLINEWISILGYELIIKSSLNTTVFRSIDQPPEDFINPLGVNVAGSHADNINTIFTLRDLNNGTIVQPNEVGVGVSQLFPLIVAANTSSKGFVAIEQPELHVHPRIQVEIGDLLTQITDGPNFIVETHSEHIILRLLKRIRQTTDEELPEGFVPVIPADVSINYLDASEHGVQITRLNIDKDGEFIERWPDGFFDERRQEFI